MSIDEQPTWMHVVHRPSSRIWQTQLKPSSRRGKHRCAGAYGALTGIPGTGLPSWLRGHSAKPDVRRDSAIPDYDYSDETCYDYPDEACDVLKDHYERRRRLSRTTMKQDSGRWSDVSSGRTSDASKLDSQLVDKNMAMWTSARSWSLWSATTSAQHCRYLQGCRHIRRCTAKETIGQLAPGAIDFAYGCVLLSNLHRGQYTGLATRPTITTILLCFPRSLDVTCSTA